MEEGGRATCDTSELHIPNEARRRMCSYQKAAGERRTSSRSTLPHHYLGDRARPRVERIGLERTKRSGAFFL